jgi:N-methylhydantoinase A
VAYNVAVDVGGPFTEVLLFDEQTGELTPARQIPTT